MTKLKNERYKGMNAPFPYFGGKSRMATAIIDRIPKHKTYAEVFSGAAWVLFKKQPSALEVLNDLDKYLMNFYRVVKHHPDALADEVAALQPSRDLFYMLRDEIDRPLLTDIQRAAAYYYIQRHAFAGRPKMPSFTTSYGHPPRCRGAIAKRMIPIVAGRLHSVMLENLPWDRFIKLYDSPETFFFIDPPYMGHNEYRHNFKSDDFNSLSDILRQIKGTFLMTHTDSTEIRDLFQWFNFQKIEISYTAHKMTQGKKRLTGHEVLISNY